ncbi:MAG: alpha/beta hydrolase [Polyangia bacterium]
MLKRSDILNGKWPRILVSAVVVALPAMLSIACVSGDGGPQSDPSRAEAAGAETRASCKRRSEAVTVSTAGGALVGTLETPAGCGPHPLVLIIPGSGSVDQNGNEPPVLNTNAYRDLAAALSQNGIASIRYNKRCVGQSVCTNQATFTFDDDVADAQLWAEQYVQDARFAGLTLLGHSEGSLFALLLAQRVPAVAVVSLEGAGVPVGQVLRQQLANELSFAPWLLEQANQIISSLEAGVPVPNVPWYLQSLLGPQVQPYLISWMKYDPAKEIAKIKQPVLIVQGTTDTQTSVEDANLLAAADPTAKLLLIKGMCHALKDATSDPLSQLLAYIDPLLPLDATLVSGVASFVQSP